jgi:hypothetical protein
MTPSEHRLRVRNSFTLNPSPLSSAEHVAKEALLLTETGNRGKFMYTSCTRAQNTILFTSGRMLCWIPWNSESCKVQSSKELGSLTVGHAEAEAPLSLGHRAPIRWHLCDP